MSDRWTRYYEAAGDGPRPTLLAALERFEAESTVRDRFAVDLGCGAGRDTVELLRRGWRVLAIDSQEEAIERLRTRDDVAVAADRLESAVADFESAALPASDLVNASFSLPFCPPDSFAVVWQRIVSSLRPGGRFCGQLFGDRDEWASQSSSSRDAWLTPSSMTFQTRTGVDELLRDFEIELLDEIEEDGATAVGDAKHWHLFHVVARIFDR